MTDVTRILSAIEAGDPSAAEELLPLVYAELRNLAAQRLAQEKPGQTLQATALVHEAYLRLVGRSALGTIAATSSPPPPRPCAASSSTMPARNVGRKHGGDRCRVELESDVASLNPNDDLLALDDALARLAVERPAKAELVKLRYFAGLTLEEAAACLNISLATAKRHWVVARAWLYDCAGRLGPGRSR